MRATDPAVTLVLILVIGIVAGVLFDRLAGPSWLARQFSGSTRGIITSALGGVDSKDSHLGANQIQGCFWGGSLGCDGAVGLKRHGVGADGTVDHRAT